MQVIIRNILKDGTGIQIEDWSKDYSCFAPCATVAVYPIAKRTNYKSILKIPEEGKPFRLELHFDNEEQAKQAYNDLLSGEKQLKDFSAYAYEPRYLDLI